MNYLDIFEKIKNDDILTRAGVYLDEKHEILIAEFLVIKSGEEYCTVQTFFHRCENDYKIEKVCNRLDFFNSLECAFEYISGALADFTSDIAEDYTDEE